MGFRIVNGKAYPVGNFQPISQDTNNVESKNLGKSSFKDILNEKLLDKNIEKQGFTLSKHAAERLKGLNFNEQDMKEFAKGFKIAEDKGSKNSVMIYKDVALVASIENKTVITAVEKERARENVFTNIDSVVIL